MGIGPPRGEFDDFIEDDEPESEEDDLLKEAKRIQAQTGCAWSEALRLAAKSPLKR